MRLIFPALMLACAVIAPAHATCLDEVARFARDICGDIERTGKMTIVDASGNIDAGVSSIIKKVVGGGNAGISGKVLEETYSNVARDQLGASVFNVIECKAKMAQAAMAKTCENVVVSEPKAAKGGLLVAAHEARFRENGRSISAFVEIRNTGSDALIMFIPQRSGFSIQNEARRGHVYTDAVTNCASGLMDIAACNAKETNNWTAIDADETIRTTISEQFYSSTESHTSDLYFMLMLRRGSEVSNVEFHLNDLKIVK